ncbi:V-type ATP synthase subunit I [Dysosmobacter sp.]|uniref:V-type ATP synthase subunit I n=1 Tax=Dysosmobacter sp. TaxID=2591382 RepID=UPI002A902FE2|nr:V-type ATP synthase subunit I [Dysosmobacter sp.]MDY3281310.1 V-type ATP synthase subunit I [Dysosmobacter sp.]
MAIVKMKKLRVVALSSQREQLLRQLLRLGCVEVSQPEEILSDPRWAALLHRENSELPAMRTRLAEVQTALDALGKYSGVKNGLFIRRRSIPEEEFLGDGAVKAAGAVTDEINGLLQTLARLQNEESGLASRRAVLLPWQAMDLPLNSPGTAHVLFRLGVCPAAVDLGEVKNELSAAEEAAELLEISSDRQQHYLLLICWRAGEDRAMEVLRHRGFGAVAFPEVSGTPAEELGRLDLALAETARKREETLTALASQGEHQEALRLYADRLTAEAAQQESQERLLTDGTILFLEGWVPAEKAGKLESLLEKEGCAYELADPLPEEYPEVPVQLKNNWLTRPLNMVTEMYSLPAYDNVDPNPLMAPFFILFYGLMMADMGYGILMMLAGWYITTRYRPKGTMGHMFSLVGLCGVSTFIFGAVTGGFFGDFLTQVVKLTTGGDFALPALFTPLNDTLPILIGSMALGFVQIVTGMAVSLVRKVKRGAYLDALLEEVTWWIVFAGIGCMALGVTNAVLWIGVALVVAGPLITGKGLGKLTGVFASLYNHVTGFFSDILSYSRIMALMLAGSVIAQVFNTLGAIPGNIVIFVVISMVGNALNFALNLLGCYVHDLRLQCLEYFNKFYEDGGKPFQPLAINTKYVDVE